MTTIHRFWAIMILAGISLANTACQPDTSDEASMAAPPAKSKVLLLSGINNHDWESTNAFLLDIMAESGLFETSVSLTPPQDADSSAWDNWNPDFSAYDVILVDYNDFAGRNYNGGNWPQNVRKNFEDYISGGGSALMIHAANNPFQGWEAYEQMVGLLWRRPDTGYRVYMDDDGNLVRMGPGEDRGAGHGVLHDWQIRVRDPEHPIMKGMPEVWMHPHDELYHAQRGPAENMHILATAYSDTTYRGTGHHELMVWWIPYGQGKVLTFLPGHHWRDQEDDRAFRDVGFRTMLNRSLEWLATGNVTLPIPDDFPTADTISLRETATSSP